MKRLLLFTLSIVLFYIAGAQSYFNKRETLNSGSLILNSVIEHNQKFYVFGTSLDSSNKLPNGNFSGIVSIKFSIFDLYGNRIKDTIYKKPQRSISIQNNSLQLLPDNSFLIGGDDVDTFGNLHLLLACFDSTGHVLWDKEYDKPMCTGIPLDFLQLKDLKPDGYGNWLMLSTIFCQPSPPAGFGKMLLTKLDSSFNVIWHKAYGDDVNNSIAGRLLIDSTGYIVSGGFTNDNLVKKNYIYRAEIFKTDTAGNTQWHWLSDANKKTFRVTDIARTSDGGYVYCGMGAGIETPGASGQFGYMSWLPWIEKINASRVPVWNNTVSQVPTDELSSGITVIKELPGGDLIAAGHLWSINHGDTAYHNNGVLVRLQSDGKIKWQRSYLSANADTFRYAIYDMKQASDGGYVMCGEATDQIYPIAQPTQRGWLLKVDSNGCQSTNDPQCWQVSVPTIPVANVSFYQLYPNPAAGQLHIRYANQSHEDVVAVLYDITGRTTLSANLSGKSGEAIIDIRHLQLGVYLYRIISPSGLEQQGKLIRQ